MSDLDSSYPERRQPGRPENDYRGILRRRLLPKGPANAVLIGVAITLIGSTLVGAWRAVPSFVTERRFITDSARRDRSEAYRDSVTYRMAGQVAALYCNSLLPDQREACREQLLPRKVP